MAPKEFYSGSFRWVPVTRNFTPGLICFALLMIMSENSSAVAWNKSEARVYLKPNRNLLEIHKRLRALNKPAVKSIQSPDGDIIDCILRHKQHAFDEPLLKNHTIQQFPTIPSGIPLSSTGNRTLKRPSQIWHLAGVRCPMGTIPVRRTSSEDLMRFVSARSYGKKLYAFQDELSITEKPQPRRTKREYAIVIVKGDRYHGSTMATNLWNPKLASRGDNSMAQMWISSGSNPFLNTIEVGWQRDTYRSTGCYNLQCAGFVQTNSRVCLGGSVNTISSYEGTQHEVLFFVWRENQTGNWWLVIKNLGRVGYWPSHIFTSLATQATMVQWGGEVAYVPKEGEHKAVQMGSGHFAAEGFRRASYMRSLRTLNADNSIQKVATWYPYVTAPDCYSLLAQPDDIRKGRFYFGGPGRNPGCP